MLQHKYQRRYNPVFHHSLCFFISCCILAILAIPTTATAKASSSTNKNLYTTLSLSKSASPKEITKAYRKLALKYHPDKVKPEERQEAERQFKEIGYAHDILSDEEKRKRYDLYGEQGLDENFQPGGMGDMGGSFGNNMGGMNMNDIFQQMNHGKGANRRRQQQQHQQQQKQQFYNNGIGGSGAGREGGVQIDLNEILQEFMMSGGPSTRSSPGRRQKRGGFGTASSGPFGDMGMGMEWEWEWMEGIQCLVNKIHSNSNSNNNNIKSLNININEANTPINPSLKYNHFIAHSMNYQMKMAVPKNSKYNSPTIMSMKRYIPFTSNPVGKMEQR